MKILLIIILFIEADSLLVDSTKKITKIDSSQVKTVSDTLMYKQQKYMEQQKAVNNKIEAILKQLKNPEKVKKIKEKIKK